MSDYGAEPAEPAESDIRRRAAWLLGLLVLVAALLVTLMVTLLGTSDGGSKHSVADLGGPSTGPASGPASVPASASAPRSTTAPAAQSAQARTTPARPTTPPTRPKCPSSATCVLPGDIGSALPAINAYRAKHGLPAVAGAVSPAAQKCAQTGGNGCTGGWAETQLGAANGSLAVTQILQYGKLLDPKTKTISVGWAYNPRQRQYNFALIRDE